MLNDDAEFYLGVYDRAEDEFTNILNRLDGILDQETYDAVQKQVYAYLGRLIP